MSLGFPPKESTVTGHSQALRKGNYSDIPGTARPRVQVELRALYPRPASAETSCCLFVLQPPWGLLPQGHRAGQQQAIPASPSSNHLPTRLVFLFWGPKLVSIFIATEYLKGGLFYLCWASQRAGWSKVVVLSTTIKALPLQGVKMLAVQMPGVLLSHVSHRILIVKKVLSQKIKVFSF